MKNGPESDTVRSLLGVVADLLRGDRHSRRTIAAATGKSLPTADRWIEHIETVLPNVRRVRDGKTTWISYDAKRSTPTKPAVVGACVAASLAGIFEGTQHERNLKDARDYLLRLRGVAYDDLDRKFFFAPRGGEYALPESGGYLDDIIDALLETRTLRFDYRHNSGDQETLLVRPLSLVIFEHQFYVLVLRNDGSPYCYRFARMSNVDAQRQTFAYPTKSEYSPRTLFDPVFGIHISGSGPVEEVEVTLSGAWAKYALDHRWHTSQQTARLEDGRVRVSLRVRLCPELETWILSFGESCVVTKPGELHERIAGRLAKARDVYAASPGSRPSLAKADPTARPHRARGPAGGKRA
jgi:predicted DNA-binding transcriptional regulator YafY